jgi:SAM-dependent methyltransferase
MKVRDSGMPGQDYWESLFDVTGILDALQVNSSLGDVVEVGCGYGTFTLPVARRIRGTLHAFDIDPAMVASTRQRISQGGAANVRVERRDVLAQGFALPASSVDAVLLFNILHAHNPVQLLRDSAAQVRPGGQLLVIHWRSDVATPRGPDLSIRPTPAQIATWAAEAGGLAAVRPAQTVQPWHFAMSLQRLV